MNDTSKVPASELERSADLFTHAAVDRRSFLRYTGATAVIGGLMLAGCKKDDDNTPAPTPVVLTSTLTNDETGALNYAYALEQLEAAFYIKVGTDSSAAFSTTELDMFKMIRDHEVAHRDFFKSVLGNNRLKDLEVDFSTINFTDKKSVLGAARAFEDLGVQAYNGAGKYLKTAGNLVLAGKIVSVEARHAAIIRNMIAQNSFGTKVGEDKTGFGGLVVPGVLDAVKATDIEKTPAQVLAIAGAYIKSTTPITNQLV